MGVLFDGHHPGNGRSDHKCTFCSSNDDGINGNTIYGLPKEAVIEVMKKYNRIR